MEVFKIKFIQEVNTKFIIVITLNSISSIIIYSKNSLALLRLRNLLLHLSKISSSKDLSQASSLRSFFHFYFKLVYHTTTL